jgi:hypothetical protein
MKSTAEMFFDQAIRFLINWTVVFYSLPVLLLAKVLSVNKTCWLWNEETLAGEWWFWRDL